MATEEEREGEAPRLATARATISLWNLAFGQSAVVDLDNEYVAMCVAAGHLVVVGPA